MPQDARQQTKDGKPFGERMTDDPSTGSEQAEGMADDRRKKIAD